MTYADPPGSVHTSYGLLGAKDQRKPPPDLVTKQSEPLQRSLLDGLSPWFWVHSLGFGLTFGHFWVNSLGFGLTFGHFWVNSLGFGLTFGEEMGQFKTNPEWCDNYEFCITNEEFCIKNEKLCI